MNKIRQYQQLKRDVASKMGFIASIRRFQKRQFSEYRVGLLRRAEVELAARIRKLNKFTKSPCDHAVQSWADGNGTVCDVCGSILGS